VRSSIQKTKFKTARLKEAQNGWAGRQFNTGSIVEKWSCGGGPQQENWSPQLLTDME
jgi:hypothetical protein